MTEQINIKPDLTDSREISFRFRKDKLGAKREAISLVVGVPSVAGIVTILQEKDSDPKAAKAWELIQEALLDKIFAAGQAIIGDDEKAQLTSQNFPIDKLTWEAIANQPKADRRVAIPEELWAEFNQEYIKVMPGLTGKTDAQVSLAAQVFIKKLVPARGDVKALTTLQSQLAIFSSSPRAEEFEDIIGFLSRRVDTYMAEAKGTDLGAL